MIDPTEPLMEFDAFFEEVNPGHEPFPWQRMLLRRVVETGEWPEAIDLPTASGKTACLEIAVFALSLAGPEDQGVPGPHRPPRRIFFVVDRRIVVDAAFARALRISSALRAPRKEATKRVADRLRALGGLGPESESITVSRLRGGAVRDLRWREDPRRAAIVTGTVDQVGSRLLFRGYGTRSRTASIDAALTSCDSLVLVDEAHCAVPFLQTVGSIARRYHTADWAEEFVVPRLRLSILSATLPEGATETFPRPEDRDAAFNHKELKRRIGSPKRAEIAVAKKPSASQLSRRGRVLWEDPLVIDAAERALSLAEKGPFCRIAVMVNRVRTAIQVHRQLLLWAGEVASVKLLTGRMRPIDRERATEGLAVLESRPKAQLESLPRPLIVVATQSLEVGADFSFDALVSECASIDALRQRFGRLDRLGDRYEGDHDTVPAAVLMRKGDTKSPSKKDVLEGRDDPIYGGALPATWSWLERHKDEAGVFDFGIEAVGAALPTQPTELNELLAPVSQAPVLLPSHLDAWVQTAPRPHADPDPAVFLHGPDRSVPEVRIVFRADLLPPQEGQPESEWQPRWMDTISLLPPLTAESISVPLPTARRWLSGSRIQARQVTDVDTQRAPEDEDPPDQGAPIPHLVWQGRERSRVSPPVGSIRPQDMIVVPAVEEWAARLGPLFQRPDGAPLDVAEPAYLMARGQPVLRLHRAVVLTDGSSAVLRDLLASLAAEEADVDPDELERILDQALEDETFPEDLREAAKRLRGVRQRRRLLPHPDRGLVLKGGAGSALLDDDDYPDDDDVTSTAPVPVGLGPHSRWVMEEAEDLAQRCLGPSWAGAFGTCGWFHDLGKADERMQVFLHGSEIAAARWEEPIAKGTPPSTARQRWALRSAVALPPGFRHEMLSMQLLERWLATNGGEVGREDLLLHLVASHHGHARPFAPPVMDQGLGEIRVELKERPLDVELSAQERAGLIPPERIDSGVADRFWRLTRRHGWWGLAYLEAVFRLADWRASRRTTEHDNTERETE